MEKKQKKTKILIVDDHKILRSGLSSLLKKQPDMEVVAEAENGRIAIELASKLQPDVIIMDIAMSDMNGIEATRQIVAKMPNVKIIALSAYSEKQFVKRMFTSGASGYLLKDSTFDELVQAISTVMSNKIYISSCLNDLLVEDYINQLVSKDVTTSTPSLTARECEVIQLIAEGKTTKEIAAHLHVSVKTVETHRQHIMEKLDIRSLAELIKYAIQEGLTSLES